MKRIFLLLILFAPLISKAQSGPDISFSRDHFPVFHLDEDRFPGTAAYTIALSYHDQDYTQLEFSIHHSEDMTGPSLILMGYRPVMWHLFPKRFL